jgi:hypothetical protein
MIDESTASRFASGGQEEMADRGESCWARRVARGVSEPAFLLRARVGRDRALQLLAPPVRLGLGGFFLFGGPWRLGLFRPSRL